MDPAAIISDLTALPQIARQSVSDSLTGEQVSSLTADGDLKQSCGLFVTIHTLNQRLRGCRGTISGTCPDLIEETRQNALSAAFDDPRFPALTLDELADIEFEISVLSDAEPVQDESELDPEIYGIIITSLDGQDQALMLPGIPQLETVEKQISATRAKAEIVEGAPVQLQRFRVDKFSEQD